MNKGYRYYVCRRGREGSCKAPGGPVRRDIAEAWVEKTIQEAVLAPGIAECYAGEIKKELAALQVAAPDLEVARRRLVAEAREMDRAIENLLSLVEGGRGGSLSAARARLETLEDRRATIRADLAAHDLPTAFRVFSADEIRDRMAQVRKNLAHLTPAERRELMELLDLRITVDGQKRGLMEVSPGGFLASTLGLSVVPGAGLARGSQRSVGHLKVAFAADLTKLPGPALLQEVIAGRVA